MDGGQEDVDERAAGEGRMDDTEPRAEEPAGAADGAEDGVVGEREQQPVHEVERVADHARAAPVGAEDRSKQERDVHPRPADLLREPEAAREDDRPDDAARERSPERHAANSSCSRPVSASATETAAFTSARWLSACGKLPRNAPVFGS